MHADINNREKERLMNGKGEGGKGVKFLIGQEGWAPDPKWRDNPLVGRGTLIHCNVQEKDGCRRRLPR